ncbi:Htaa domain protein, partial [Streptomyces sp. SID8455]|nr:Htaa domain protein [Streptomyces sp. SID8455]
MDPVSLAVAVDDKARLPALPDLGSEPTDAAEPTAKASAKPSAAPVAAASDSGPGAGTYAAIGGGVLLLAAAGTFFALRRRGAGQGPDADATSAGSDAPQTS